MKLGFPLVCGGSARLFRWTSLQVHGSSGSLQVSSDLNGRDLQSLLPPPAPVSGASQEALGLHGDQLTAFQRRQPAGHRQEGVRAHVRTQQEERQT